MWFRYYTALELTINHQSKGPRMKIKPCNPEIISTENYIPTEIPNLFINPKTETAVIVDSKVAYRITTK